MTETEVHSDVTWTSEAWDQRATMMNNIYRVENYYGQGVENEMLRSVAQCFLTLFSSGPTRAVKDGDGLLFFTPYITIGMVWSPDSDAAMKRRLARYGHHYTDDEFRAEWPRTGEWSLHS